MTTPPKPPRLKLRDPDPDWRFVVLVENCGDVSYFGHASRDAAQADARQWAEYSDRVMVLQTELMDVAKEWDT